MLTTQDYARRIKSLRDFVGNRDLDHDEALEMDDLLKGLARSQALDKSMSVIDPGSGFGVTVTDNGSPYHVTAGGGPGDQFVQSEQWRTLDRRQKNWSSGAVDVGYNLKAGTLLEGSGGQGAGLNPVPYLQPGVVTKLLDPLGVADVFGQATTTTTPVRYMIEGTATSGAVGVAEGALKPASDLTVSTVDEPVKKIATTVTVSDELTDDGPSVQAYINSRLSLFVQLEEERQLLRGGGTNDLIGVFGRSGVNTVAKAAGDDNATALAKVIANTAGSSFLSPDAIIMHPTNWLNTRLLRDGTGGTVGQFYGGGPFTGAYGDGGAQGMFGQSLWGLPVVLSNYVGAGTALVGNFRQAATIYRKGGRTVEVSNSHSDYFQRNLNMVRSESRLALAVFRPGAFSVLTAVA